MGRGCGEGAQPQTPPRWGGDTPYPLGASILAPTALDLTRAFGALPRRLHSPLATSSGPAPACNSTVY